jgi:phosphatidylserine/phosphatidylglycerophosphate/cardiolipin synthase-like enzyme
MDFAATVDQVIRRHLGELAKPGVLSVRPGYQAAGQWLTKKPAIVVTVAEKRDDLPPDQRLPETIEGYPVDVRQADPLQQIRGQNQGLFASVVASAPPELERPVMPFERDMSGNLLSPTSELAAALRLSKPFVQYQAPPGFPLDPIEDDLTIICHVSPDAGLLELKPFLAAVRQRLTVGMYDFTSATILDAVTVAMSGKTLNLVLDHPPKNRTADQTDEQSRDRLAQALGGGFNFAWALERNDPLAAGWSFPNAYHIKVAVRDEQAFWLSSGNWNNSNQPNIDPLGDPVSAAPITRKSDRDWHVIVQHDGLAATFEAYLQNDLKSALQHQAAPTAEASLLASVAGLAERPISISPRTPRQYFAPKTISARMKIQPVLTPDNYMTCILPLITSAKRSFYMQTQYVHLNQSDNQNMSALVLAVSQLMQNGLDVRLIMSQYEYLDKLELLQSAGVNLSQVRIQGNVHNKGMIIDGEIAVVGSQNWSEDGVSRNRDATLIIYNCDAAQYWNSVFMHDWTCMAAQQALD